MVNLQSSIDELQKEYNSNYEKLEELEKSYKDTRKTGNKKQKIETELRYMIESRQLEVRKQMLQNSIKSLKSEQQQINQLSDKYQVNLKLENNSEEELNRDMNHLQENMEEQYKKLDVLAAQDVISNMLGNISDSKILVLFAQLMVGLLSFVLVVPPMLASCITSSIVRGPLVMLSFVVPCLFTGIFMTKNRKKYKKILQKLNSELEQDNPLYEIDYETTKLNQLINELSNGHLRLQQQKTMLEIEKSRTEIYNLMYQPLAQAKTPSMKEEQVMESSSQSFEIESTDKAKIKKGCSIW